MRIRAPAPQLIRVLCERVGSDETLKEASPRMGLPRQSEELATLLSRPSFLQRTGQAWKLSLGNGLLVIGGALIVGGEFLLKGHASMTSILIGTLVATAGFTWECLSVRCPQCGVRVVWYTYTHRSHLDAMTWAQHQPTCPKCGYDPS